MWKTELYGETQGEASRIRENNFGNPTQKSHSRDLPLNNTVRFRTVFIKHNNNLIIN